MEFKIYQDREKINETGNVNSDYRVLFPQTVEEAVVVKNDFTDEDTLKSVLEYIYEHKSCVVASEDEPTNTIGSTHWLKIIGTYNNGSIGNLYLYYILNHIFRKHDGTTVIKETENVICKANVEVYPITKEYDGYASENVNKITITERGQIVDCYYDEQQYGITYVLNGGVNSESNPTSIYYTEEFTLENAAKEKYTFSGWYLDNDFVTKVSKLSKITNDITLYAKFTETKYTITYILNGGENSDDNPSSISSSDTVVLKSANKTGYIFDGWYTNSSFTEDSKITTLENLTSDITLYAKFLEKGHTISNYSLANTITYALDEEGSLYACGVNTARGFGCLNSTIEEATKLTKIVYPEDENERDAYVNKFNFIDGYSDSMFSGITTASIHQGRYEDLYNITDKLVSWDCYINRIYYFPSNYKYYKMQTFQENIIGKFVRVNKYGISIITNDNKLVTAGAAGLCGINSNVSNIWNSWQMEPSDYISNTIMSDMNEYRRYRIDTSNNLYEWKPATKNGKWDKLRSGISDVSCGLKHALILDTSGNLYSGGDNYYNYDKDENGNYTYYASGALGLSIDTTLTSDGNYIIHNISDLHTYDDSINTYDFVQVKIGTKFKDISCGDWHSLALDTDGNLWAFGMNSYGEIGDGTNNTRLTPVQIMPGTKFVSVKAKAHNSSAVDEEGNVWIWGNNESGQLGNGTKVNSNIPIVLKL